MFQSNQFPTNHNLVALPKTFRDREPQSCNRRFIAASLQKSYTPIETVTNGAWDHRKEVHHGRSVPMMRTDQGAKDNDQQPSKKAFVREFGCFNNSCRNFAQSGSLAIAVPLDRRGRHRLFRAATSSQANSPTDPAAHHRLKTENQPLPNRVSPRGPCLIDSTNGSGNPNAPRSSVARIFKTRASGRERERGTAESE